MGRTINHEVRGGDHRDDRAFVSESAPRRRFPNNPIAHSIRPYLEQILGRLNPFYNRLLGVRSRYPRLIIGAYEPGVFQQSDQIA